VGRPGSPLHRRLLIHRKAARLDLDHLRARRHLTPVRPSPLLCRRLLFHCHLSARLVNILQNHCLASALQCRFPQVHRRPIARRSMDLRPFLRSLPPARSRRRLLRPSLRPVLRLARSILLPVYPTLSLNLVPALGPYPVVEFDRPKVLLLRPRLRVCLRPTQGQVCRSPCPCLSLAALRRSLSRLSRSLLREPGLQATRRLQ
jgi:hypothetical protein